MKVTGWPLALAIVLAVLLCVSFALWNARAAGQAAEVTIGHGTRVRGLVWDGLLSNELLQVYRTRVPGGWFVVVRDKEPHRTLPVGGAFFYPDLEHVWDGSTLPK